MQEISEANWFVRNKKKLGQTLLIGGLLAWIPLMVYIVIIKQPSPLLIATTLLCWAVFFVGKTLLKTGSVYEEPEE